MRTIQQQKDYALHRMEIAIERFLGNRSKEEKAQTIKWVSAWKGLHAALLLVRKPDSLGN